MACSIYKIINLKNEKLYIGSAVYFPSRKALHLFQLRNNKHFNKHLQSAFNKYGEESFKFEILEECFKDNLIEREQFYINTLKPKYNKRVIANSNLGRKYIMKEDHKRKIGLKHRKISDKQITEIIQLRKQGMIIRKIGEKFGVDASCISRILNGKFYKGSVNEVDFNNKKSYQWQAVV
jgi:group I intron endonuclease